MKLLSYLKKKAKHVLGITMLMALMSQLFLPATIVMAHGSGNIDGPRFNFLDGDRPLLTGANVSAGQNSWETAVSGQSGDEFRGMIYYHNGMQNTTAEDVTVNVSIPTETHDGKAVVRAAISADNADTVTATVVDGQIVGSNGLLVSFPQDEILSFVPGSVKWFPDSNENGGADQTPALLPLGQTGDELVSSQGLNIGDINGCWPYAGFISFGFRATEIPVLTPALVINKTVRDVTTGEQNFVKSDQAYSGDTLEYQVTVSNTGNGPADQVNVSDILPANTQYIAGSTEISQNGSDFQPTSDGITAGGIPFDEIAPGETDVIDFRVLTSTGIASGQVLCNTALIGNLTSKAETTIIVVPVTPAKVTPAGLPVTGADTAAASLVVSLMGGTGVYYAKYRRFMGTKEIKIISDLLKR